MAKEIHIAVKRIETKTFVISDEEGYDVPDGLGDFVRFTEQIKNDIVEVTEGEGSVPWKSEEFEIVEFECVDTKKEKVDGNQWKNI